jgi:hypothetical protein
MVPSVVVLALNSIENGGVVCSVQLIESVLFCFSSVRTLSDYC